MTATRPFTIAGLAILAFAAAPALAEVRPVAVTTVQPGVHPAAATVPAASGEVRDIVQTAFFQALSAPAPTNPR